jgi:hypothetical protein
MAGPTILPATPGPDDWPIPRGWRSERIPFPIDFAPALPCVGIEEVRFAPGFFDPAADDFWSYVIVWWLAEGPSDGALPLDLATYYRGLSTAVADPEALDQTTFEVRLDRPRAHVRRGHPANAIEGWIDSFEPFRTRLPLRLRLSVDRWTCEQSDRQPVVIQASPRPGADPVWRRLRRVGRAFGCHET